MMIIDTASCAPQLPSARFTETSWMTIPAAVAGVLRPHQVEQFDAIRTAFEAGMQHVLAQAPTGAGKTHIFSVIAKAALEAGHRVLILATRTKIIRQIHERLDSFEVMHGVIAAPLPALTNHSAAVQVASVDTLYRRGIADRRMPLPSADVVIFDEAHLALGQSRIALLEQYPDALHLGFTATPAKISGRPLRERFDVLVRGPNIRDLIAAGLLVRPRIFAAPVMTQSELSGIARDSKTNDYVVSELGATMARPKLVGDVRENWLRIANEKRTLVFACNKAHGAALVEEFTRSGIEAELLTDETAEADREDAISRLERGETTILVNCFLLSYGIDIPSVECIVLARPTRSVVLYQQAVGRGLRPSPGKDHVIVIDHGRIVENLGMPHEDCAWSLEEGNVNTAARGAKERLFAAQQPRTCPRCKHMWLVSEEGPNCTSCGWVPVQKAKQIAAVNAELAELGGDPNSTHDPARFFAESLGWYRTRWPDRWTAKQKSARWWAWMQTRSILNLSAERPPSRFWEITPLAPSAPVAGQLKARIIAYAKARADA
jgi:DNA repair protein RadD